jgi:hypothetical protein
MAIPGYKSLVKISGAPVAFIDEPTTADAQFKVYTISNDTKSVWDPEAPVAVAINGTPASTSEYTVNRLFGKVTFKTELLETDVVTVSGSYLPMATVAQAYELRYNIQATNGDITAFQDTWTKRTQAHLDASGSFEKWFIFSETLAQELISSDSPVVVEMQFNNQVDLRAWALLSSVEPSVQAKQIQTEGIQWESTTDIDGRAISDGN